MSEFNFEGKKVHVAGRFSCKKAEVVAKMKELGATIVEELEQAHALVAGSGAKEKLHEASARGLLWLGEDSVARMLSATRRPPERPMCNRYGESTFEIMDFEQLQLTDEPIAALRNVLDLAPSYTTFQRVLQIVKPLFGEERTLALEYAAPHVAAWPAPFRMMYGFSPRHMCWPLYGGIRMRHSDCPVHVDPESDWLHEALYALDEHPHIQLVDMYNRHLKPDAFRNCGHLLHLEADSCHFEDPAALKALTQLRYLSLDALSEHKAVLREVAELSQLRFLRASGWRYLGFADFQSLTQLTGLSLVEAGLGSLKACTALSQLECLDLRGNSSLRKISGLRGMTNLRTLSLSSCKGIKGEEICKTLAAMPWLEYLFLEDVKPLPSFDFLAALPNLKFLEISDQPRLENLDALSHATKLEGLVIRNCERLQDISALGSLSLEGLKLITASALQDLSTLEDMPDLKALRLCELGVAEALSGELEDKHNDWRYVWEDGLPPFM